MKNGNNVVVPMLILNTCFSGFFVNYMFYTFTTAKIQKSFQFS